MKRLLVMTFVFISVVFLSGCIEFNLKLELNPDGSGTITEEVLFSQKFVNMMQDFSKMGGEEGESFKMFDPEDLKNKAGDYGEGVELVKTETLERKTMTGYSAVYRFKDINKLELKDDPVSKMPDDIPGQEEETGSPYTFSFVKGDPSTLKIFFDPGEEEEEFESDEEWESDDENDMMFQQVKDMMRDMKTSIVIEIDGEIVNTNATYVKDNKITLIDLNFGTLFNNPEKLEQFKKMKPKGFDKVKEFLSDVDGVKVELNKELVVKFK